MPRTAANRIGKSIVHILVSFQSLRHRPGVEQRHVRALPDQCTRRMPGIADVDQPPRDRARERTMRMAGEGQLVERADLFEQRRGTGPERQNARFPRLEAIASP